MTSALVVTTPAAAGPENGASRRVADVEGVLQQAGVRVTRVVGLPPPGCWDIGVAVSYASAQHLRALRARTRRLWLDAVDSWLLVDSSGLRAGDPTYAARAVRDAVRLLQAPRVDVLTYISDADLSADHGLVRAVERLVLPGRTPVPLAGPRRGPRRVVLAGDWSYGPNRDGLRWWVRRVAPLLDLPQGWEVHVFGAGAGPVKGAVMHGHVADGGELHQAGDVHVAPVAHGAGVKRKVLGPLLAGLPVVTTPAGAHGLRPHPLLRVTRTAEEFAGAVRRAFAEPEPPRPAAAADLHDRDDTDQLVNRLRTWSKSVS